MHATIVFYDPKSTQASILGVCIKLGLLILPVLLGLWLMPFVGLNEFVGLFVGLIIGILLMFKSEALVYPIIGTKQEFHFTDTQVSIITAKENLIIPITELRNVTAFESHLEGGSVKHLTITLNSGEQYKLFDTWITNRTLKDFEKVYAHYAQG